MMGRGVLESASQCGVADQERRVGRVVERNVVRVGHEHPEKDGRRRALRGDGDRSDALERQLRDELDRAGRAVGGDTEAGQYHQPIGMACPGDGGDRRDVDLPVQQRAVELRRDTRYLLNVGLETEEDRSHVQIGDAAESDHSGHPSEVDGRACNFGSRPAPLLGVSLTVENAPVCDTARRICDITCRAGCRPQITPSPTGRT
jgi:hypothetical protein